MVDSTSHDSSRAYSSVTIKQRGLGVVLVDQIPLFRDGLSNLVTHTPGLRWLGSTQNVHAAMMMTERLNPDIIVLDSVLDPRGHLTKLLLGQSTALTIISLVRDPHRNAQFLTETIAAGAHGVVLRSAAPGQIIDALRRAHTERRYLDPALTTLTREIGARSPSARQPLSKREYQVLQLIADGLENQAIAKALFVSVETVRTHVKSILRKLHARDRAHAVAIAFRLGVLVPHAERQVPEQPSQPPQLRRATELRAARA